MLSVSKKKDFLRRNILQERLRLSFEEVFRLSASVQKRFLGLKALEDSRRLALYASFRNEVLTDTIFEQMIAQKKEVFFPQVVRGKKGLVFLKVNGKEDFTTGSYKIKEPASNSETEIGEPSSFDVILVPGVAFDAAGNRLGYGKGYYDRVLSGLKPECLIVALAFNFQITDHIPAEAHDIKMDKIITESRVINIERGN